MRRLIRSVAAHRRRSGRPAVPCPQGRPPQARRPRATSRARWTATRGRCSSSSMRSSAAGAGSRRSRSARASRGSPPTWRRATRRPRSRAAPRRVVDWSGGTRIGASLQRVQRRLGPAGPVARRGRGDRLGRLGARGSRARRSRDGAARPCRLRRRLGQPAEGAPGLPAARRRDARGAPVRRPVPPGPQSERVSKSWRPCSPASKGGTPHEGDPGRGRALAIRTARRWSSRRWSRRALGTAPGRHELAVSESGRSCGSVSGGCVESDVYENATRGARDRASRSCSRTASRTRRPGRSACPAAARSTCSWSRSSEVPRAPGRAPRGRRARRPLHGRRGRRRGSEGARARGRRARSATASRTGARAGRRADPRAAATSCSRSDGRRRSSPRWYGPPPRLVVYGAVDTAESLCSGREAPRLDGDRGGRARRSSRRRSGCRAPTELIVAWPEEALAEVAPDHATAVVVLTHDDKFDEPALKAALETRGVLRRRARLAPNDQERRRERLLEAGVAEAALDRISGPCGLDIGADRSPRRRSRSSRRSSPCGRAGRAGRLPRLEAPHPRRAVVRVGRPGVAIATPVEGLGSRSDAQTAGSNR